MASGLHASVTMPRSACSRRSPCCCRRGCSSIWLTAGVTPVSSMIRSRCAGWKFDTPMARVRPCLLRLDQALPRLDVAVLRGHRPVDEVEVDVLHLEAVQAVAQRALGLVEAVVVVEALGRDEDVVALEARGVDGLADGGLVAVGRGGVDVPVAREQGARGGLGGLFGRHLEDPEAELGDLDVAAQRDGRNLAGGEAHPPALPGLGRAKRPASACPRRWWSEARCGWRGSRCGARAAPPAGAAPAASAGSGAARAPRQRLRAPELQRSGGVLMRRGRARTPTGAGAGAPRRPRRACARRRPRAGRR